MTQIIAALTIALLSFAAQAQWSYFADTDEMRGVTTKWAATASVNTLDFDFPHNGGSVGRIHIRKRGKAGNELIFSVSKGQLLCHSYSCRVSLKFDDGPVKTLTGNPPDNASSTVIYLPGSLVETIKKSKKLIIEAPFYKDGRRQMIFDVQNLVWPQKD